jgi:hypothetical protein
MRTFAQQVYDTNGATPKQNVINQMNARNNAQSNLAKSGGASVTVPQFGSSKNAVSPDNPNTHATRMASAQLRMDSAAKAQANTGQKINGGTRRRKTKNRKRKSRKY